MKHFIIWALLFSGHFSFYLLLVQFNLCLNFAKALKRRPQTFVKVCSI